jgi:putative ABC transport system permease protein
MLILARFDRNLLLNSSVLELMTMFWADVRQSFRNLVQSPSFTFIAITVLALGIGANTAVFTLLNELLLKPLPYPESNRLVFVGRSTTGGFGTSISIPKFNVWKKANQVLDHMAAFDQGGPGLNLKGAEFPEQVRAIHASADYFALFGAAPLLGRTFSAEEDSPGGPKVAVLSFGVWTRMFGGAKDIVGRSVTLGSDPYTIVGVIGPGFHSTPETDVWLPLQADPNSTNHGHYLFVAARLKPGVTLDAANAQLRLAGEEFRRLYPEWMDSKESVSAVPMQQQLAGDFRPTVLILMGAVGFVLLIACANLASLLLARAVGRQRQLTIRLALGATRLQLIRQLLTESVLLAVMGGVAGLALAYFGVHALVAFVTANIPAGAINVDTSGMSVNDWRVLLFMVAVSTATGILFGLVPALQFSRGDLNTILQQTGGRSGMGAGHHRSRSILVTGEIALALVLLISATLLIRTITALRSVNAGFDPTNVLIMQTSLNSTRYTTNHALENLGIQAVRRIESIPGVLGASAAIAAPLIGLGIDLPFTIEGRPPSGGDRYNGDEQWRLVGPHYFSTLNIPVRKGRVFTDRDNLAATRAVIINETMAKKHWKDEDPIGKRITIGQGLGPQFEEPAREIIGIVGDVREDGFNKPAPAVMYVPMAQVSDGFVGFMNSVLPITWIVRTAAPSASITETIRREFLSLDSQLAIAKVRPLAEANSATLFRERISTSLLGIFAAIALVLAVVGVYGLMSHSVEQRTLELGVRLSLGAAASDIYKLILGQAIKLTLIGLLVGIAGAVGLTQLLGSLLYGVGASDPVTFVGVSLVLGVIAFIAAYIPARRAIRINPIVALRAWEG